MAKRDDKLSDSSTAGGEFTWPRPVAGLRPLTEQEIEALETELERPIDRDYLAHWISTSISNVVTLSILPSPAQCRDGLQRLARQGRKWLDQIDDCPGRALLEESNVTALRASVVQFCQRTEFLAARFGESVKPGQNPTPPALTAFLDNMIGIAKRAKLVPSTPQRFMKTLRPSPPFFNFVKAALAIAEAVIESSPLTDHQRSRALRSLLLYSSDALIKILERLRGRIGDYHESAFGLVEDNSKPTKTRRLRSGQ